jgi:hypothetical protein
MRLNLSSLRSHSSRLIDPYHKFSSNIQAVGAREVWVSSIGPFNRGDGPPRCKNCVWKNFA